MAKTLVVICSPKMRNFMWRVFRNCIPAPKNLRSKHVEVQLLCPVCNSGRENLDHVLFSCPYSQRNWDIARLNFQHLEDITP